MASRSQAREPATAPASAAVESAAARRVRPRGPRSQRVLESLRQAIIVGEHVDGERLIEDRIARELKTSRGPVREALKQLEHEGLVVSYPYRGAVVLAVSDEEVHEVLIPIRLTLERFSCSKALERMVDADFAELAKHVWLMGEAAKDGNLLASVDADVDFHEFVLSCSGQPHTVQVWRSIAPRIRAYFFRYGRAADLARIAEEHGALLASLRAGDRDDVMEVLERHILVRTPGVVQRAEGS